MVNFSCKQALCVILFSVTATVQADDPNFLRLLGASSDDDGEQVCMSTDGNSCCPDSVHEVTNDGTLYCSKFEIAVSANGKGIEKTYPDGNKNTVWWLNIDPCQLNSMDLCHFDHDDNVDTTVSIQSDTAATTDDAVVTEPTASDGITPEDGAEDAATSDPEDPCVANEDCAAGEYCSTVDGTCLMNGQCASNEDCDNVGNLYAAVMCVGTMYCVESAAGLPRMCSNICLGTSQECSAYEACAGLDGACCPDKEGEFLACCTEIATTDDAVVTEPTASDGITPEDDADTTASITVPEDEASEPTASDGIIPEDDADTTSIATVGSVASITTVGSVVIVMVVTVAAVLAM